MPEQISSSLLNQFEKITGRLSNRDNPNRELAHWLNTTYPRTPKTPELKQLACQIAWALAEGNLAQAFTNLYPQQAIEAAANPQLQVTTAQFKSGQFVMVKQTNAYVPISAKNWNKILIADKRLVDTLYPLYETALQEIASSNQPDWLKQEASNTLMGCFNLEREKVIDFVQDHSNRLATMMATDVFAQAFPATTQFWQAYTSSYHITPSATLKTKIAANANLGLSPINNPAETFAELASQKTVASDLMKKNSLDENEIAALIAERKKQAPREQLLAEYKTTVSAVITTRPLIQKEQIKQFLANRKNTNKDTGYTSDPYSAENLFCARLALSLVDFTKANPREQFWRLLYPQLTGVFLGQSDSDWPDYGEALLSEKQPNFLINYRKIAIMAQHPDARSVIMGEEQKDDRKPDEILQRSITQHPQYRGGLSAQDRTHIKKFNSADHIYWQGKISSEINTIMGRDIPNYLVFFQNLNSVFEKYNTHFRANVERNHEITGSDIGDIGLKVVAPYISVFDLPGFKDRLEAAISQQVKQGQDITNSESTAYKLKFLLDLRIRWEDCFGQKHEIISQYLRDQDVKKALEDISLASSQSYVWENDKPQGRDHRPSDANVNIDYNSCLEKATDIKVLLKLIAHNSINNIPLDLLSKHFLVLTKQLSIKNLHDLFINEAVDVYFINSLFPEGIPAARIKTAEDCKFALRLHDRFSISNRMATLEITSQLLKEMISTGTLSIYQQKTFNSVRQSIIALIETVHPDQLDFLNSIALPTPPNELAQFLRLLTEKHLATGINFFGEKINLQLKAMSIDDLGVFFETFPADKLQMALTILKPILSEKINDMNKLIRFTRKFDAEPAKQIVLVNFFFNLIKKHALPNITEIFSKLFDVLSVEAKSQLITLLMNEVTDTKKNQYFLNLLETYARRPNLTNDDIDYITAIINDFCKTLTAEQLKPLLHSIYYAIYYLTSSKAIFNILNWNPRGTQAEEIAKITSILECTVNLHGKIVREFHIAGDEERQKQVITAMFSRPYIFNRLFLNTINFDGFQKSFQNYFIKNVNVNNDVIIKWRAIALETILNSFIETLAGLNKFLDDTSANDVRLTLGIIQRIKPDIDITELYNKSNFAENCDNLLALLEVIDGQQPPVGSEKREKIINQLADLPNEKRNITANKVLLDYYLENDDFDNIAWVLANTFENGQNLDHTITLKQFEGFHAIFNKHYLFSENDNRNNSCIQHYFKQLSPVDKTAALLSNLNNKNYYALSSQNRKLLADGLSMHDNDGQLYSQALDQLMGNQFTTQHLKTIENTIAPYLNVQQSFLSISKESIALAKVIQQFILDKKSQPLTQEDKVILYILMAPYMENRDQHKNMVGKSRTLYTNLVDSYLALKQDIGFSQQTSSPPAYVLSVAINQKGLLADHDAYTDALAGKATQPTSAATTRTMLSTQSSASSTSSAARSSYTQPLHYK